MDYHFQIAENITRLLDTEFKLGRFRFGLDPLLGLVPGAGDAIPFVLSLYLIWIGYSLQIPREKLAVMIANTVADFVFGSIPVLGDIGDFVFKANTRNMAILKEHEHLISKKPKMARS